MLASDIAIPVTRTVPSGTDKLWVTATLNGGSSPTVSAVVSIRASADGALTKANLKTLEDALLTDNSTPVTVRTLSNQVSESSTPAAGSFVSLGKVANFAEFDFASLTFGGTVVCDYMVVNFWRLTGNDTVGTYLDKLVVYPNQIANINRKIVCVNSSKVYTTVTFVGGTAPTVSGTITARNIDIAGLNKSDFSFDTKNNLKTVDETYDISADANRSYLVVDHTDKWSSEKPAEITGTGLVTFNADIDMRGYNKLGIQIIGTSGVASSIKFAIQTTKDTNVSPQFVTVTGAVKNMAAADALLVPDGSGDIAIPTSSTSYDLNLSNVNALFVRIRWTVVAHANNILYCDVYKSA